MRSLFAELLNEDYRLENDKHLREQMNMLVTIDNRPIYDHTMGDGVIIKDKRSAIDMLMVRRDIRQTNVILKWVHSGSMLADCLTKGSASPGLLLEVFRSGRYAVVLESMAPERTQPCTRGDVNSKTEFTHG